MLPVAALVLTAHRRPELQPWRMSTPTSGRPIIVLPAFVALSFLAALGGALFPPGEDYARLVRPSFAPPNWLFGPVWTALYLMMAIAAWQVWQRAGAWSPPLRAWYLQQALNAAWTPLFFGLGWRGLALLEMIALWIAILITALRFRPHSRPGFWLLLPYLAWVSFALLLNGGFWWLNR